MDIQQTKIVLQKAQFVQFVQGEIKYFMFITPISYFSTDFLKDISMAKTNIFQKPLYRLLSA